jgi:hypothetical protein
MNILKAISKNYFAIKKYADKRQFTIRFMVIDAPATFSEKELAAFYPVTGFNRYLKLLFGIKGNYFRVKLERIGNKSEAEFSIIVDGLINGTRIFQNLATVSAASMNVLTIIFGKSLHIRLNNRVMVKDVDFSGMENGYRIYTDNATSADGWLIKIV